MKQKWLRDKNLPACVAGKGRSETADRRLSYFLSVAGDTVEFSYSFLASLDFSCLAAV